MDEDGSCWYAFLTGPRREKQVRHELAEYGAEPLLPLVSRLSLWKGHTKRIEYALFPGYCFARVTGATDRTVVPLIEALSIVRGPDGRPAPLPEADLRAIQRLMTFEGPLASYPGRAQGPLVDVTRGPLTGLHGTLLREASGCRLVVSIDLIGQGAAVPVDPADVTPVDHLIAI